MAGFRGQLFKLVFDRKIRSTKPTRQEVWRHFGRSILVHLCYYYTYFKSLKYYYRLFSHNNTKFSVLRGLIFEDYSRSIMPPKAKRSAGTKAEESGKRKRASKKDAGSSDENGVEEQKVPSRQSKRNINKVVTYRDEDFSEDELPKKRGGGGGGKSSKRAKSEEESDLSGGDEAPVKPKAGSKNKKKAKAPESDHDLSASDSDDGKSKGDNKKSKSQEGDGSGDDEEGGDDEDDDEDNKSEGNKSKKKGNDVDNGNGVNSGDDESDEEKDTKKSKKDKEPPAKKAKVDKPLLNKTDSNYDEIDFSSNKTTPGGEPWNLKISSWNVGGLKALVKKNGMDFLKHEKPDIFCMQETKCSENKLPPEVKVDGYHKYWLSGEKEGYAGVSLFSKEKPISVKYGIGNDEFDKEGRLITAEYEKFYLVAVYVPNAGRGLVTLPKRMKWDPELRNHLKELDAKKPVILIGDMNVSHQAIDLANPKTNTKSAGFTQEERDGMTALLGEGFIDSFRHLYPEKTGAYTFWTYMGNARSRNTGWRLDYFILSEKLKDNLCDSIIRSDVYGSDHCPITLLVHI